ncbi:MAG: peptidoglycan bridge formation glycyltransferase FemA/FemB family protein [bacterium]|nr:peptidoglycan bridge formation glycyltransferase FemA/FemB family protein [bacterium]
MKIIILTNKQQLDNFVGDEKQSQFLQSWEWGEFQATTGNKIIRLGVVSETEELLAVATLIKKPLLMGKSYFFCPRGPVLNQLRITNYKLQVENVLYFLFSEIQKIAQDEKVIFLRFEPQYKIQNTKYKKLLMLNQVKL